MSMDSWWELGRVLATRELSWNRGGSSVPFAERRAISNSHFTEKRERLTRTSALISTCQKTLDDAQKAANSLKDTYGAKSSQYTDAQRAIDAYGKQGVDNGVTIAQGKVGADTAETAVVGAAGAKTANNPNGQNITVTFDKASNMLNGQNVDAVAALTAHEGVHVADQSDWVSSGFSDSAHPSNLQTDHDAYTVELNIFYGLGNSNAAISFGQRDYRFSLPLQSGSGGRIDSMIKREDPRWNLDAWQKNTAGAH
jgi:hypothetical protein